MSISYKEKKTTKSLSEKKSKNKSKEIMMQQTQLQAVANKR